MFFTSFNLQLQNYWLSLLSYLLTILLGIAAGWMLLFLPGVAEALLVYTTLPLYSITGVLITFIKMIKD